MSVIIYHNARCSKSRETLKLLNENNVNVEVQSINKQDHLTTLVLKVSDFELGYLSIIEDFLKKNRISKKEIQFFSSSE